MFSFSYYKNNIAFIVTASLLLLGFFIAEKINHRFWLNDFRVYYDAFNAFMKGSQLYGVNFSLGSGNYKYSPFSLLLFAPFSFFSFDIAAILYYFFLSTFIIFLFIFCLKL